MKNLYSCLFILFFLSSCSDDNGTNATDDTTGVTATAFRLANELPANSDNPYDAAGKLHSDIFYGYYNSATLPTTLPLIRDRVALVANAMPGFNDLKGSGYRDVQLVKVQSILSNPLGCIPEVINGTGMSAAGKLSLNIYITKLVALTAVESNYTVIYDNVCAYETVVLADPLLTAKDKKVILITTSIARHSIHCAKKRPKKNTDPDWTIFVGNLMGDTYGGDNDTAEAITTALVTGIAQN